MRSRRANPFGVGIGDMIKWGALVGGGLWLLSKFPGNLIEQAANQITSGFVSEGNKAPLVGPGPVSNGAVSIRSVNWPSINRSGQPITITWATTGVQPGYTLGLQIRLLVVSGIDSQTIEATVGTPSSDGVYSTTQTLTVTTGIYDTYAYIKDSSGALIVSNAYQQGTFRSLTVF